MESGWKSKRLINPKEGKKGDKVEHETHRTNRKRVWTKYYNCKTEGRQSR